MSTICSFFGGKNMLEYVGESLSILYLVITPFLWRKLVNLLEKIGWMSGIVALISTQIPSIFGDYAQVKFITFFGSIAVLGITGIFHLKSLKSEKSQKYDAKKLNNNIFRKLTRAIFTHDWYGNLTFRIPTDESAFAPRKSGAYTHWLISSANDRDSNFRQIDNVIHDLNIGEKYLKSSYPEIYRKWEEIKKLVDEHNKKHEDFLNKLGLMFEKEFNSQFQDFIEEEKEKKIGEDLLNGNRIKNFLFFKESNFFKDVYILKNIKKLLYRSILNSSEHELPSTFSNLNFKSSFYGSDYWLLSHGSSDPIIITKNKDKIDTEKIKKILNSIANDNKVIIQFHESHSVHPTMWDKLSDFQEKLEDEVVNDIDNQV